MRRVTLTDRLLARLVRAHADRTYARFARETRDTAGVQERLLRSILRGNAGSGYGQQHGFGSMRGYDDYARRMPITTYADLAPWIERVRAGDTGAMFGGGQRVRMFAMTSGTVDTPKYVPVTDRFLHQHRSGWQAFGAKALTDHPTAFGRPILQVTSPMDEETAPGGLPCGAITGLMAATQKKLVRKYYVSPLDVAYIPDTDARRYTIMRLAMPVNVGWIVTASPATVLQLARTGERLAESIIRDVHDGTLSREVDVPDEVRRALAPRLRAAPVAAKQLERLRSEHGRLLPKHYWRLAFLANWTGGTMGLYLRDYPEYFGDTPVRDIGLLATEGRMSIPIRDATPAGVAAISSVFLEFIPASEYGSASHLTLRAHEVVAGEEYYVLLTTTAGFYRYDICDCVRVVGYENEAPVFEFLHKGAHVSSLTGEKITERQVVLAFDQAARSVGRRVEDFVLAARWSDPPFYRLYIGPGPAPAALATAVDAHLGRLNIEYASKRSSARLRAIEPVIVQRGAFQALDQRRAIRFRAANEQFKHQYLLTTPGEDGDLEAAAEGHF